MSARPEPIRVIEGAVAPLTRDNVDTDQIMPKQFLKRVEKTGFGPFVFHEWRRSGDFVLDDPAFADAAVLVTGANFGCGSSREQAVWGLLDAGIAAVVAPSFAPIFRGNAGRARLLTVELGEADCRALAQRALAEPGVRVRIDVAAQQVSLPDGSSRAFELDRRTRDAFVEGVDEIERTLGLEDAIAAHERGRAAWLPTTPGPAGAPARPGVADVE